MQRENSFSFPDYIRGIQAFAAVRNSREMSIAATLYHSRNNVMFDLHNHCLPGVDDGSRDWDESLAMARIAVADGIEGVVCTPHWVRGSYDNNRDSTLAIVAVFKEKLKEYEIPLKVYPGAEIRLEYDLLPEIESGRILTLNDTGRVVLIELPPEIVPRNLENMLWNLQVQNLTPIISHPERNPALQRDPMRLYRLTEMGILTQVTAASLLGSFGETVRKFTISLLEHRMAHIIATDAHGLGVRSPRLSAAYEKAAKIVGEETASQMVREIPWQVIQGEPVSAPDPVPLEVRGSKPSFWRKAFSSMGLISRPH
jgi:protein-tyrosine phosphatase